MIGYDIPWSGPFFWINLMMVWDVILIDALQPYLSPRDPYNKYGPTPIPICNESQGGGLGSARAKLRRRVQDRLDNAFRPVLGDWPDQGKGPAGELWEDS